MKHKKIEQYRREAKEILNKDYGELQQYFTSEITETALSLILIDFLNHLQEEKEGEKK